MAGALSRRPIHCGQLTFRINTKPVTIIGIAPNGFYGDRLMPSPPEFYLPIETMPPIANVPYVHGTETQWLYMVGRVRPGVSLPQLQQKVSALLRQQLAATDQFTSPADLERMKRFHIVLTPGGAGIQAMQKQYDEHLQLLMWVSAIVLLIACANLANLLLVRGMARKPEVNLRTALGARRGRIVRQLLTESLLLASLGGLAGLAVAYAGTRMLLAFAFPGAENIPIDASPSTTVLAFAFGLSLLTGVLFGVAPAYVASKSSPVDALRSGMRSVTGGATLLLQKALVVTAGRALARSVGGSRSVREKPEQARAHRPQARSRQPVHRAHQSSDGWLLAASGRRALSRHRRALPLFARSRQGWHHQLHSDGRQQQWLGRADLLKTQRARRSYLDQGECRLF